MKNWFRLLPQINPSSSHDWAAMFPFESFVWNPIIARNSFPLRNARSKYFPRIIWTTSRASSANLIWGIISNELFLYIEVFPPLCPLAHIAHINQACVCKLNVMHAATRQTESNHRGESHAEIFNDYTYVVCFRIASQTIYFLQRKALLDLALESSTLLVPKFPILKPLTFRWQHQTFFAAALCIRESLKSFTLSI